MGRFFFTLFWLLVVLGVDILALFVIANPFVGAVVELILFIVTFSVPYLRKKDSYTRWWGWLALFSAIGLISLGLGH
ncbi:MAG: hypothetical protein MJZ74_04820 [Muribaculaceae bacterium]|nr:hypothetical protein [Muribaculaceae bacterium]